MLHWPGEWLQKIGMGILVGFVVTSATFNIMSGTYDAHKARKREALENNKLIEFGQYKLAFGAMLISLVALIVSILAYLK